MHELHRYLFAAAWWAWAIGWFASSFFASAPKRVQDPGARLLLVAELVVVFALLCSPRLGVGWLGRRIVPRTESLFTAGAALLLAGLAFTAWARVCLGRNWSGQVTLKQGHRLIRRGPYALVRHPIYTGLLLAFLGTAVALDEYRGLLAVLIALQSFVRKYRLEERWLTEEFGGEYERYKREVKALVPGVF
ncbi:MAG TPA: isoprenylcysteine carboxylmethyltransferase family protein [Opitutaceae bacterium]|jgi:protein-S-isoprenylcysteine O-methyltransferase Ste14